jgi:hypothetical protein
MHFSREKQFIFDRTHNPLLWHVTNTKYLLDTHQPYTSCLHLSLVWSAKSVMAYFDQAKLIRYTEMDGLNS